MSVPTARPPKPPRQGRVHFNPDLARPRPLATIPHGSQTLLALDHRRCLTARQISRLYYRGAAEALPDPVERLRAIAAADRQVNRRILRPLKDGALITVVRPFLRGETTHGEYHPRRTWHLHSWPYNLSLGKPQKSYEAWPFRDKRFWTKSERKTPVIAPEQEAAGSIPAGRTRREIPLIYFRKRAN